MTFIEFCEFVGLFLMIAFIRIIIAVIISGMNAGDDTVAFIVDFISTSILIAEGIIRLVHTGVIKG